VTTIPTAGVSLLHGDALLLLRDIPDESVDLVLTDPPYSSGGMYRGDRAGGDTAAKYTGGRARYDIRPDFDGDTRDQRGFLAWCSLWLAECWRATTLGGSCLIFTDWRQLPTVTDAVQAGGWVWRGIVVWDKTIGNVRPRPGFSSAAEYLVWGTRGAYDSDTYIPGVIPAATPRNRIHQTEKPIGLLERLIDICPPGGLVLDPFAGSASTLDAARNRGRRAIGIELNDEHLENGALRLHQGSIGGPVG
jgi:site-specific DNA-methyltransferase (adenine-specific)